MLTDSKEVLDRWREYVEDLFRSPDGHALHCDKTKAKDLEPVPMKDEVRVAIKNLGKQKAPGIDQISAEIIQASGEAGVEIMHKLCCSIWKHEEWAEDWTAQELKVLHKSGIHVIATTTGQLHS